MENGVVGAITKSLGAKFPNYCIYVDNVPQGLQLPCFFVDQIQSKAIKTNNTRYESFLHFDIVFYPEQTLATHAFLRDISEILRYEVLENLQIRENERRDGENMHCEIIDNILHFFVSYRFDVVREISEEDSFMESLQNELIVQRGE